MPKTIQIRDVDDEVYAGLRRRAAEAGVTVPELLRAEARRLAERPSIETWLKSVRDRQGPGVEDGFVVEALRELRGSGD